ncbi:methyltransferase domain-containing protein [Criblamydia sequanensis]|uniref:Nudix hydrolase n=1 Tax=Candidatus Criblamydia sequanensis CRIB-18 TaxID=1437425 RepID=A0A090CZD9_9BACT|nr:methyltransferase domain-containing protein [Criblamydia sequanensis]CDR34402.1 Nudix hydrolase [Criblamydia sequanensis CRIB-18]
MTSTWKELHDYYKGQDWTLKPSIFAETVKEYLTNGGKILELGSGLGQDSLFFLNHGFEVVSTDIDPSPLEEIVSKLTEEKKTQISVKKIDLNNCLPFEDNSFDCVYAHLSLHYFNIEITTQIFREIERILKPGALITFLSNSIHDPEIKEGMFLEKNFYNIRGVSKRYFSVEFTRKVTKNFEVHLLDDLGQTYKDEAKGVKNLIRFIGRKPVERNFGAALPFVAGIIERTHDGVLEVLIQTRWKPSSDPVYTGTLEFPAGSLDRPYETVYEAMAREIDEECGLRLKKIKHEDKTEIYEPNFDAAFGFKSFCCTQQLKGGKPWIGFIFICEVEDAEPKLESDESRDIGWMKAKEMKEIFLTSPEKIFTLELPAWEYYFKERNI